METLPPVVRPTDVVGEVTEKAERETGLAAGTPVVCGSNDTTVEFFGVGAIEPGIGAIKLATAGVLFLAVQGPSVHPPMMRLTIFLLDAKWRFSPNGNS